MSKPSDTRIGIEPVPTEPVCTCLDCMWREDTEVYSYCCLDDEYLVRRDYKACDGFLPKD